MKRNLALKIAASLVGIAFALGAPQGAYAVGTAACTSISNTASVTFNVGGVPQGPGGLGLTSVAAAFKVGNKVNVDVTTPDGTWQTVYPGTADGAMHFRIDNLGNAYQRYVLTTAVALTSQFGGTETFDATQPPVSGRAIRIHNAVNGAGAYTEYATDKTIVLAPGEYILAEVLSDISLAEVDQEISSHYLMATTWNADGSTPTTEADNPIQTGPAGATTCTNAEGAYVVFADTVAGSDDGVKDGVDSIRDAYKVCAADLTIAKSSVVYWDPINLFVSPKAIPGAIITYTVTATNNGAAFCADATNVTIADSLNTEIATNGTLAFRTQFDNSNDAGGVACGAGNGILIKEGAGASTCKTNATDAEGAPLADFSAGNVVDAGPMTIPFGGTSTTVKFQAIIQ